MKMNDSRPTKGDSLAKPDKDTPSGGSSLPNPEYRQYYRVAAFFIFGELLILAGCSYIPNPDNYWLAVLTVTVSYMVFLAMIVQTKVSQEQSRAMMQQVDIALRQFELTDRPWLIFELAVNGPLLFTEQGLNLPFRLVAKNVGRSVAVNATIHPALVPGPWGPGGWAWLRNEHELICNNIDSGFMSYAIFPEKSFIVDYNFGLDSKTIEKGRVERSKLLHLYLMGCVDYQFSGHQSHHQTRFAFEIFRVSPENPDRPILLEFGTDVPQELVLLRKVALGGLDYAD